MLCWVQPGPPRWKGWSRWHLGKVCKNCASEERAKGGSYYCLKGVYRQSETLLSYKLRCNKQVGKWEIPIRYKVGSWALMVFQVFSFFLLWGCGRLPGLSILIMPCPFSFIFYRIYAVNIIKKMSRKEISQPHFMEMRVSSQKHQEDSRANILAGNQKITVVSSTLNEAICFRWSELTSNSLCFAKTRRTYNKMFSKIFHLLG